MKLAIRAVIPAIILAFAVPVAASAARPVTTHLRAGTGGCLNTAGFAAPCLPSRFGTQQWTFRGGRLISGGECLLLKPARTVQAGSCRHATRWSFTGATIRPAAAQKLCLTAPGVMFLVTAQDCVAGFRAQSWRRN